MAKYDRKQLMHRVQIALGELHLSSMTMADKKRLAYVEQGLLALDEEQALLKTGIEELLEKHQAGGGRADRVNLSGELVAGLKKLVNDPRPRVAYPDRKLLGDVSDPVDGERLKAQILDALVPFEDALNQDLLLGADEEGLKLIEEGVGMLKRLTVNRIPLRGPAPSKSTVKQLVGVQKKLGKIPKTNIRVK